ncbi:MAG: hypothetical protein J6T60_09835 [Bacteroidales bacterium]|nr:hypothetical protein [Bacteroidales bacterium]
MQFGSYCTLRQIVLLCISIRRLLTLENDGKNGNYWSSSVNDANNAWNLNFNSDDADVNNNNRKNGLSVRAVRCSIHLIIFRRIFLFLIP